MASQVALSASTRNGRQRRNEQVEIGRGPIRKFMQTIGPEMFLELERISLEKGIHVQTLLRAVIIPEWMKQHGLSTRDIRASVAFSSVGRRRGSSRNLAVH